MEMSTNVIPERGNNEIARLGNISQVADQIQAGEAVSLRLEDLRPVSNELRRRGAVVVRGAL